MALIDVKDIISDVEWRLSLLAKMISPNPDLTDEEWNSLVYYGSLHKNQREEFIQAFEDISSGTPPLEACGGLSPHARWLLAVYTGQELSAQWCMGGSRFHSRVLGLLGANFAPRKILKQIKGLSEAVRDLQQRLPQINPQVIENIAVDETFELLGREMR